MSFGVGTVLLSHIMQEAKQKGKKVKADFRHTGRNRMMYVTFKFANFKEEPGNEADSLLLTNDLSSIQEFPAYVDITMG
jgi:hypothetical protein